MYMSDMYIYVCIYIYIYIYREQNAFCSFTTPQAFWQSSAPGALSTLGTSVILYSLTRATLMSPGKDKTHACGYISSPKISSKLTPRVSDHTLTYVQVKDFDHYLVLIFF